MMQAVEDSLRRLQTDYIDLYQSHRDDPATPMAETLGAYDELIKQGKVRYIGASNFTAERLAEALDTSKREGLPRYESLQPVYNLVQRADYEQDLEPLCRKEEIGVIPYSSLASGFLSGKYKADQVPKLIRRRGAGLDCRPTGHDRPDRQRHDAGSASGPDRRHRPQARRRCAGHARQSQRLAERSMIH